jgi:hypothetical protein
MARSIVGASVALAAILAGVYLLWAPPSQDLAAAVFRAELFEASGFALWNNSWYSGHHLLSYSVLYPPLAALLDPRLVGALAAVAAAAVFAALAQRRFGARGLVPALWFAAGIAAWLLTGRMPFLLAVPFGLGALLAADRDRPGLGAALAALSSLASPVAGLFVAIAGAAIAIAGERDRGIWLALGALIPISILNLAFPVGGEEPFVLDAFIAVPLLAAAALWLVPAEHRALRIGVLLYALVAVAIFAIPNPLGGNVTRLGALFAGPVLALVLWPRGRLVVIAVSLPLLYWQLVAPVRDVAKAAGDPATELGFYAPLMEELGRLSGAGESFRVQIPPTENRWEATYVAADYPIARGWLRQLEHEDFDLFTDGNLTPAAYEDWLERHGVSYVAVADADLDYLAEDEVELIDSGLDYLVPIWNGGDWRLFRVEGARAWGLEGMDIEAIGPDRFTAELGEGGTGELPINWTRYWSVVEGEGCVEEGEHGAVTLDAAGPGAVTVEARVGGDRCSG